MVDRLFTRVGASDNLARGQSTFMVEMSETSAILHNATARSLVLLDEIGRGTSTYDGVAIAWAVTEHLHDTVGCKTMFATHYHELMQLPERLQHARNFNVAVRESGGTVVFLHRLEPGGTDRSYGIHVAQLAGLPDEVVRRATRDARDARGRASRGGRRAARGPGSRAVAALRRDAAARSRWWTELRALDVDAMTPLEALNRLSGLQKKAAGAERRKDARTRSRNTLRRGVFAPGYGVCDLLRLQLRRPQAAVEIGEQHVIPSTASRSSRRGRSAVYPSGS